MSLSRILNDDPIPMPPAPSLPVPIDPALMHTSPRLNSGVRSPPSRPYPHSQLNHHGEPPPPRGHTYQPIAYQGAGGWDPYTGEWVQGDIFPLGPGGNYYQTQPFVSPHEHQRGTTSRMYYKEEEEEEEEEEQQVVDTPRKRRKGGDEDTDYHPPGQRRVSLFHFFA